MKYTAIVEFSDLQDNGRKYLVGDEFPRKGFSVSNARLEELATNKNRRGFPVIKAVEGEPEVKEDTANVEVTEATETEAEVAEVVKPTKRGRRKA